MIFATGKPLFDLGELYLLIMVVRAVLSYFPYSPGSPLNPVRRFTTAATEPVVAPFRRIIPPVGMFDLSYFVAFLVIYLIVHNVLSRIG